MAEATFTNAGAACDGDPSGNPEAFRQCLAQFATGVTVITANVGGELIGITANSFSALSLDPPLILWSVGKASNRGQKFCTATSFAVNVLASDQVELSRLFGSSNADKFMRIEWSEGRNGAPVLRGIAALFECELEAQYPGGDHSILVGRVTRAATFERSTLIFAQGRYRLAVDHPALKAFSA
ncbi:flavin reductase (DIM6/NTAB) family NADH-FMN oxidoreductase RutF [Nitrobacteraceae bacterium AZCC 2161]